MDRLDIERLGGFAGFGGSGSHLRSRGQMDGASLSAADQQAVDALFAGPPKTAPKTADGFRYRITRHAPGGSKTVEVSEEHVPDAIKCSVKDELI